MMCEREAAIFPHSPSLPIHVHTTTPKHRCGFAEMNSAPKSTSVLRQQDSTPAFSAYLSQSARCLSGQSLGLIGNTEESAAFYTYSASLYSVSQ